MIRTLATDGAFDGAERQLLEDLAGLMIPAGDGVPSAADAAILTPVLTALGQRKETVRAGLGKLVELAAAIGKQPFPALGTAQRLSLVEALRGQAPGFVSLFESTVAVCYYRDDRVLRSLDLPARAPFPEGNAVDPTDWSLLDPVRARPPFYRNV